MKRKISITFVLLITVTHVFCQTYRPLKIGDTLPDLSITNFYNQPGRSERLSDLYHHKLLILDFWGTWCVACLEEMPKFKELKKKYGDKIQIVAVGYEPRERMDKLFKRNPALNSADYLIAYNDSILTRKLFPHVSLPHNAWIDQNGKVVAITDGDKITPENIDRVLAGKNLAVRMKLDKMDLGLDAIYKPFHLKDTSYQYRSILTKGIAGALSWQGFQGASDTEKVYHFNRSYFFNASIYSLYWGALFNGRRSDHNGNLLKIITRDSLKFFHPKQAPRSFKNSRYKDIDAWADSNLYIYDLTLPQKVEEYTLRRYMVEDLNRALNLNGHYELIESDCFLLIRHPDKAASPLDTIETRKIYGKRKNIRQLSMMGLTDLLNEKIDNGMITSDFAENDRHQVTLNTEIRRGVTGDQINRILKPLGYSIVPARRKVKVFIIAEN